MQTGIRPNRHPDDLWEIYAICRRYTKLKDTDVGIIVAAARQVGLIAELTDCDVFIEAMLENGIDSVVLAWGTPAQGTSLYKKSVVGELAFAISEPAVFRTMRTGVASRDVRGISQEGVPIAQTVTPIRNPLGDVIGALIMERNIEAEINEERQVEMLSQTAERLSDTLMHLSMTEVGFKDWMGNGLYVIDEQGYIVYANAEATDCFKELVNEQALGNRFALICPDFSPEARVGGDAGVPKELRIGSKVFTLKCHNLVGEGRINGCVVSLKNITDLRMKEKELDMKSTIIAEIHHRVKNNLQNIAALLRMQARRTDSPLVREEFASSINRIVSIALAYDVFARQPMQTVDLVEMVQGIVNSLLDSMGNQGRQFLCRVRGAKIPIPHAQAVPLALAANELVTNSIKHAMPGHPDGIVDVFIRCTSRSIMLCVKDNGLEDLPERRAGIRHSLGLDIVRKLAEDQLSGRFTLARSRGKTFAILCFSREEP